MNSLSLLPVISEKAMALTEALNTYMFLVPISAGKIEIAKAVKQQFGVQPLAVRTLTHKGKPQSTMVQRGRRRITGKRSNVKKAFITLGKGDSISFGEDKK